MTTPWRDGGRPVFRLIPREERFFDLFEEQGRNIAAAAERLREMIFDFSDAPAKAMAIKELEHAADVLTHETHPEDQHHLHHAVRPGGHPRAGLAARRRPRPDRGGRGPAGPLPHQGADLGRPGLRGGDRQDAPTRCRRAVACLRTSSKGYHTHCVEVNRLENEADRLLKDAHRRPVRRRDRPDRGDQVEGDLREPGEGHRPM